MEETHLTVDPRTLFSSSCVSRRRCRPRRYIIWYAFTRKLSCRRETQNTQKIRAQGRKRVLTR